MANKTVNPSTCRFPLPDHLLPRVRIDDDTLDQWKSEAMELIDGGLLDPNSWYYKYDQLQGEYKPLYDKHGIRGCARPYRDTSVVEYVCRGELQLSLEDMVYGLHCETNAQQRAVGAQLYQQHCLDSAIVELFEGARLDDPFHSAAVKWVSVAMPMKQILNYRDFLYFEYCMTTTDLEGRTVLVEYKKSKNLRPDQLTDHHMSMTRGNTHAVTTYHMEGDRLVAIVLGYTDNQGNVPARVTMSYMHVLFERMLNHYGLIDAKALQQAGVTPATLATKNHESPSGCRVCRKKFGLRRHKSYCRACGHAVCRSCNMKIILLHEGLQIAPRLPYSRERFCLRCLIYARELRIKRASEDNQRSFRVTSVSDTRSDSFFGSFTDDSELDGLLALGDGEPLLEEDFAGMSVNDEPTHFAPPGPESDTMRMARLVTQEATFLRTLYQERVDNGDMSTASHVSSMSSRSDSSHEQD